MMHLFWAALCSVLPHLPLSAPQRCTVQEDSSLSNVLLQSLQCKNDYESYVHCKWRHDRNTTLQLWLHTDRNRELCEPYQAPGQHGMAQCRVETGVWSIGTKHTFFFLKNETQAICSSDALRPVRLSQHLRTRPPVDLSTQGTGDGGRRISWSCPYPQASSLSNSLTYQLRYRPDASDNWTTEDTSDTHMKLDKQRLLPGHRYEAKVRSRAGVAHWSHWSHVVTWQTPDDTGRPPSLHCVLDGETEVVCSWEMSAELAHLISYQLVCRQNHTAQSERCCMSPAVRSELRGSVLRYSCSLTVADPAQLLLELLPTHNAKTFDARSHIQPKRPQEVTLKQENSGDWLVKWTKMEKSKDLTLYYQVCYYRTDQQDSCKCVNTSALRQTIPAGNLVPSQAYEVKVRSLVDPGAGSIYEGIASEWSDPQRWTTDPVYQPAYFLLGVFVASLFLVFYCAFPACQRRLMLWVDSVPSPGKSKILHEIKTLTSRAVAQSEDTSICKVLHFDSVYTCSSHDKATLQLDADVWNCDNLFTLTEKAHSSETSSMSFSGPYIFCQTSKAAQTSAGVTCEEQVKEDKASLDDAPSPHFALFGEGYVGLPGRVVSRSTQELVSHSDASGQAHVCDGAEQDTTQTSIRPELGEATSREQPPAYSSAAFSPWPQGGHVKASGYCFLPQPK